jgi:hypothetical protein
MRKSMLAVASALAFICPAAAADLRVIPYSEAPGYTPEYGAYEYRNAPPVVIEEPGPIASETLVVRRPIVVAPPPTVIEEYPVYASPDVYPAPHVYAYAGPRWGDGWRHRRHFSRW